MHMHGQCVIWRVPQESLEFIHKLAETLRDEALLLNSSEHVDDEVRRAIELSLEEQSSPQMQPCMGAAEVAGEAAAITELLDIHEERLECGANAAETAADTMARTHAADSHVETSTEPQQQAQQQVKAAEISDELAIPDVAHKPAVDEDDDDVIDLTDSVPALTGAKPRIIPDAD